MQALTFEQVGLGFVILVVIGGVFIKVQRDTRVSVIEQTSQFNELSKTFQDNISALTQTVEKLNITLEFFQKDINRVDNRLTIQGKEIDEFARRQSANESTLERHEKRLDKIEEKC